MPGSERNGQRRLRYCHNMGSQPSSMRWVVKEPRSLRIDRFVYVGLAVSEPIGDYLWGPIEVSQLRCGACGAIPFLALP